MKRGSIELARSLCFEIAGPTDEDDNEGRGYGSVDVAEILSAEVVRLRERIAALEAERDALRRVVAAADAMRRYDSYRMPGEPHWQYDVARAALKEGKP